MSDDREIRYEVEEQIRTITFNRPERRNPISLAMLDEMVSAVGRPAGRCRARAGLAADTARFCESPCGSVSPPEAAETPMNDTPRIRTPIDERTIEEVSVAPPTRSIPRSSTARST